VTVFYPLASIRVNLPIPFLSSEDLELNYSSTHSSVRVLGDYCHFLTYTLEGFKKEGDKLFAVVEQTFVISDRIVDLNDVESFFKVKGFIKPNPLKNDYKNKELGIILEELHDENVLQNKGELFL
jgi:hypothetical protein